MPKTTLDFSTCAADFQRDGVAVARGCLDEQDMALIEQCYEIKRSDKKSFGQELYPGVQYSLGISIEVPIFARLIRESAMADLAFALFGNTDVWYHNDQIWFKEGGTGRRTPWHQDSGYEHSEGSKIVNLWVPLDSLAKENVLETVLGSHRGPLYNPPNYDPADDTAPTYADASYPRMPNIEAEREKWSIFSTAMNRGDVLAFHPAILHGGAPIFPGQRRRSFTFRFFGDDAKYRAHGRRLSSQSGSVELREENLAVGVGGLKPGDPLSKSKEFRRVRPWTD